MNAHGESGLSDRETAVLHEVVEQSRPRREVAASVFKLPWCHAKSRGHLNYFTVQINLPPQGSAKIRHCLYLTGEPMRHDHLLYGFT